MSFGEFLSKLMLIHGEPRLERGMEYSFSRHQTGRSGILESLLVETVLPPGTTSVPAKRIIEAGSPTRKERAASAMSE